MFQSGKHVHHVDVLPVRPQRGYQRTRAGVGATPSACTAVIHATGQQRGHVVGTGDAVLCDDMGRDHLPVSVGRPRLGHHLRR